MGWFHKDWKYCKVKAITSAVADYPMELTIGYNSASYDVNCQGLCDDEFFDIRVTKADGVTEIQYDVVDRSDAYETIKLLSDVAGSVCVYFGNPSAPDAHFALKNACWEMAVHAEQLWAGEYVTSENKIYLTFQDLQYYPVMTYYDLSTGESYGDYGVVETVSEIDNHNTPSMIVDNDGYKHVAYGSHATAQKYVRSYGTDHHIIDATNTSYTDLPSAGSIGKIYGDTWRAMVFQADVTGPVNFIRLYIDKDGTPTSDLTVKLCPTLDLKPKPADYLLSFTIPIASIGTSPGWVSTPVSATSTTLTAGTFYAIVLHATGNASNYYNWDCTTNSAYGGAGEGYTASSNAGTTWQAVSATTDLFFSVQFKAWQAMSDLWTYATYPKFGRYDSGATHEIWVFATADNTDADHSYTRYAYRKSTDGGDSWTASIPILNGWNTVIGDSKSPYVTDTIFDSSGNIHVAWTWYDQATAVTANVYYIWYDRVNTKWKDSEGNDLSALIAAGGVTPANSDNAAYTIKVRTYAPGSIMYMGAKVLLEADGTRIGIVWYEAANYHFTDYNGSDWTTLLVSQAVTNPWYGAPFVFAEPDGGGDGGDIRIWGHYGTPRNIRCYRLTSSGGVWSWAGTYGDPITSNTGTDLHAFGFGFIRNATYASDILFLYSQTSIGTPTTMHAYPTDISTGWKTRPFPAVYTFADNFDRDGVSNYAQSPSYYGAYLCVDQDNDGYWGSGHTQNSPDITIVSDVLSIAAQGAGDYAYAQTQWPFDLSAWAGLHLSVVINKSGKTTTRACVGLIKAANGWDTVGALLPEDGLRIRFDDDTHLSVSLQDGGTEYVLVNNDTTTAGNGVIDFYYMFDDGAWDLDFTPDGGAIDHIDTGTRAGLETSLNLFLGSYGVASGQAISFDDLTLVSWSETAPTWGSSSSLVQLGATAGANF